ncbi:MAG: CGNR zinc finger domain-containing protein [Actinobacteria bacterium]|nr:CGNR zinc finger domain-containing protein [Actinomycetota bacterium]
MIPETLILLANLGLPRRPTGAATRHSEPVLPDAESANRQLAALISDPVTDRDLPAVRRVHQAAVGAATALLAGAPVDCPAISALAHRSTGRLELAAEGDGTLRRRLAWEDPSVSSYLARRLIEELATLDPQRLRRCARAECSLLFYDTTRSRTQRWHAEDPCGWRERQRQRRASQP